MKQKPPFFKSPAIGIFLLVGIALLQFKHSGALYFWSDKPHHVLLSAIRNFKPVVPYHIHQEFSNAVSDTIYQMEVNEEDVVTILLNAGFRVVTDISKDDITDKYENLAPDRIVTFHKNAAFINLQIVGKWYEITAVFEKGKVVAMGASIHHFSI